LAVLVKLFRRFPVTFGQCPPSPPVVLYFFPFPRVSFLFRSVLRRFRWRSLRNFETVPPSWISGPSLPPPFAAASTLSRRRPFLALGLPRKDEIRPDACARSSSAVTGIIVRNCKFPRKRISSRASMPPLARFIPTKVLSFLVGFLFIRLPF